MKKVLIITYYWPPSGGAGVQRWLKFVKYLPQLGWQPVVFTPSNPEIPVADHSLEKDIPKNTEIIKIPIWEPYQFYKKFTGRKKEDKLGTGFLSEKKKSSFTDKLSVWIRGNFFIPDARKFWIKPATSYLIKYLKENPVDAIITTGPPHSMHMIGLNLKKQFPKLNWVADFRDPWTNIDFYQDLMLSSAADTKHHEMELAVLKHADHVISVGKTMSDELQEILEQKTKTTANKFEVICNGFDEDDLSKIPIEKDKKFSIAHIGSLVKSRNPVLLWKTLNKLSDSSEFAAALEIKLVGKIDIVVMDSIKEYGLEKFIHKIDYLPHDEVILEQMKSQVLLLLVNNTKNAKGILTGKFFEYMAAGTSIIAIGPEEGDLAAIMKETDCGLISGFEDAKQLEKNILHEFENFKSEKKNSHNDKITPYSRLELTKRLVGILNQV